MKIMEDDIEPREYFITMLITAIPTAVAALAAVIVVIYTLAGK